MERMHLPKSRPVSSHNFPFVQDPSAFTKTTVAWWFGEVYGGIFTRGGERHASELVALKVLKRYQGDGRRRKRRLDFF